MGISGSNLDPISFNMEQSILMFEPWIYGSQLHSQRCRKGARVRSFTWVRRWMVGAEDLLINTLQTRAEGRPLAPWLKRATGALLNLDPHFNLCLHESSSLAEALGGKMVDNCWYSIFTRTRWILLFFLESCAYIFQAYSWFGRLLHQRVWVPRLSLGFPFPSTPPP